MRSLSQILKELRKEKRWTLGEVAEKLQLRGHSTYSNWEYGRTEPDNEMLVRIAQMYGVTLDYLLGRTDDPSISLSEDARTILEVLDLTDEEIAGKIGLSVDGVELSQEDLIRFVANVRAERQIKGLRNK